MGSRCRLRDWREERGCQPKKVSISGAGDAGVQGPGSWRDRSFHGRCQKSSSECLSFLTQMTEGQGRRLSMMEGAAV